jgi:ergothioneine biosynthesis protein EgtB
MTAGRTMNPTLHTRVSRHRSLDYDTVRDTTERLAASLSAEDQTVQSMPDASPAKWHRAHTTWFFETFVLGEHLPGHEPFRPEYTYLFNSYYEALGPRHSRPERGMITRPGITEIGDYRAHVDAAMQRLLADGPEEAVLDLVELGLHHEQQHQELLVMDITHALSRHPFPTGYGELPWAAPTVPPRAAHWIGVDGGVVEIGHEGDGFAFDNEGPRHEVLLQPFEIADRLVTCGDWTAFIDDDGYHRPELWMSAGWAEARASGWRAPEYWYLVDGAWQRFGLLGLQPIDPSAPVEHLSWYEADAYARWAGARLPLEAEWEVAAPRPDGPDTGDWYGRVWQWTASQYTAYPRFRPAAGAVGEYNGKFMANQHVLRGSCRATPPGHARRTYRNFYPAQSRWMFSGLRMARDA